MTSVSALRNVPFIGNTDDNLHCLQASYGMIRHFFEPGWHIDWSEWARTTGYVEGKGSWSFAGLMWFTQNGYDVVHITAFDYHRFVNEGETYLREALGDEAGSWEAAFTDMPLEQARCREFIQTGIWQHRKPSLADLQLYLDRGYLLKCLINLNFLNDIPGFLGHAVVVLGYTESEIIIHDPGLPPLPNRHVNINKFMAAWTNPNSNMEKMDAIKLKHIDFK